MRFDEPKVRGVLRRAMVARIATLSREGRPSVTPLYFIRKGDHIWLGTPEWTLAARHIANDARVSILLKVERAPKDREVVRITGRARIRTDKHALRTYDLRVARKYVLTAGAIRDTLAHLRLLPVRHRYREQSAERGRSCIIEVTPARVEVLTPNQRT